MLNLTTGSGDFTPYLKYDAKSGRWKAKPSSDSKMPEEVFTDPVLAMDFANIRTGWIAYPTGAAPQKVWDTPEMKAAKPPAIGLSEFKNGFELVVYGAQGIRELGGEKLGLREFNSTALVTKTAILAAYQIWQAEAAKRPGEIPVFKSNGVLRIPSKNGDNFQPVLELEKWIPRIAVPAFDEALGKSSNGHHQAPLPLTAHTGAAKASTPVDPPARKPTIDLQTAEF